PRLSYGKPIPNMPQVLWEDNRRNELGCLLFHAFSRFFCAPQRGALSFLSASLNSFPSLTLPQLLSSLMRLVNRRSGDRSSELFPKRSLHAFCPRAPVPLYARAFG